MCPGFLDSDLTDTNCIRKTKVIDRELSLLNVDIAALQETRLPDNGSIREDHYTFFWQGYSKEQHRLHGAGFAIRNTLINSITTPIGVSERIMTLRLNTKSGFMSIICVYAPTLTSKADDKSAFYEALQAVIDKVPSGEDLVILGDFNARVGADHSVWPNCIGQFGIGSINDNGQRLLELCSQNTLCITNTFFGVKDRHKVSWRHPRSGHWHQIDHIVTRRHDLKRVKISRSYHSADCDTDHVLVICKFKLETKKVYRSKVPAIPKINVSATKDEAKRAKFESLFTTKMKDFTEGATVDETWKMLSSAIHECAIDSFERQKVSNNDWVTLNSTTLIPLIEAKRAAHMECTKAPSQSSTAALKVAKANLQREVRRCANKYWVDLCNSIQEAHDRGDMKTAYSKMKTALGPPTSKSAPLKSLEGHAITDTNEQLARWVEHYSLLYSKEDMMPLDFGNHLPNLPQMAELDEKPTLKELSDAIDHLSPGKAPGSDNIPAEILHDLKGPLLPRLYELLIQCWEEGEIPHDMRDAKIVTLYKNKGDKGDCNNYRGISLLSITGKAFARVILCRLQRLAERVLPESQCGFRSKRSTVDMVFALRQIQEKCREQQMPLLTCFVDLTKAFDTVNRSGLYAVLKAIGCPPTLLKLIVSFHTEMNARVSFEGCTSDSFAVNNGVKQGCVLAPTLFGIYFAALLRSAFEHCPGGVLVNTRADGSIFNIARLKAKTKVEQEMMKELLFADDAAIVAHDEATLQALVDSMSAACDRFQLKISISKTVVMSQEVENAKPILLNGSPLEQVEKFCYLGSVLSGNCSLDQEINGRIGKAATVYGKLSKRVWNNPKLTIKTRVLVYQTCVLSTLLYGSETWTTYAKHERKLNTFHLRCLRKLLNIKWQDRVPNVEVLKKVGIPSMQALLGKRRLRWLGHVHRMDNSRIPRQILYGELAAGSRKRGRPQLRFKDACKATMLSFQIDPTNWEATAENRNAWRKCLHLGMAAYDKKTEVLYQSRRDRRKDPNRQSQPIRLTCNYCKRTLGSNIGRISHERKCQVAK